MNQWVPEGPCLGIQGCQAHKVGLEKWSQLGGKVSNLCHPCSAGA